MNTTLQSARSIALTALTRFANSNKFWGDFELAFGQNYDRQIALNIRNRLANNTFIPPEIVIVDRQTLGTANAAYATQNSTIYISKYFLDTNNTQRIAATLIEEIGHLIDAIINTRDSRGDEGQIFSALVRGETLTPAQLAKLKAENDHAVITIGGQKISVEQDAVTGTTGDDTLNGTSGNDTISGLDGNDRIYSDKGSDTINGGAGFDYYEADYSDRTTGLTMTYDSATGNGKITVGTEVDTLISIDSFNRYFKGTNFNDVIVGTADNENYYGIQGLDGNDAISGGAGRDQIFGGNGNDVLIGVNPNSANAGRYERDYLSGGTGSDRFVLGDSTWAGYDDGNNTTIGDSDYADIVDFNTSEGDTIQLQGASGDYSLVVSGADTKILINKPGTEPDEFIAIIRNQTALSLTANYFTYVLPQVSLVAIPLTVTEDGTTNLTYTFTRAGVTTNPLTVNYSVGGTATLGVDYAQTGAASFTATTGTVTFAAGATTAVVTIDPTTDTVFETDETVALTLTNGTGYSLLATNQAAIGTITNDDTRGKIKGINWNDLNGNGVREELIQGNSPDIVFVVDVSASTIDQFQGLAVGDINGDGTANTRLDAELAGFIALNNRLIAKGLGNTAKISIVAFESSATQLDMNSAVSGIQLATNAATDSNNNGIKDVEEILRSLTTLGGTNFESGLQKAATTFTSLGTLPGNGNLIFISDGNNTEGGSYTDEVLSLKNAGVLLSAFGVGAGSSLPNLQAINPNASIFNSTDQLLAVFDGLGTGTQDFKEPGLGGVTIYLDANNNGILDGSEQTQVTATDNLSTPGIDETGQYSFDVAPGTYTVREVVPAGFTQTFPNNPAFHTVIVAPGQTVDNINFGNTTPSAVTLAVNPATVTEDGLNNLVYTFTRTGNLSNALKVNYTVGGTGTFNTDYTQLGASSFNASTGSVTFAAGLSTATVSINPTTDTTVETNETVDLKLAIGTGYTVGTTTVVTGTISNDDTNVTLAVAPATVNEDGTTNLTYTFTRTGVTTNALTVNYGVGGTATLGTDYAQTGAASFTATNGTVTFAAGATTAIVTIDPTADTVFEADETVALTLINGAGYGVGTIAAATGTITNDDTQVNLALGTSPATEDGIANLVYTFTRTGNTANALTVNYGVGGTATFGTDYAQTGATSFSTTTGTVVFSAGATTAIVTIDPTTDTVVEANETVALTLAIGAGYSVGTTTAITGTINNDDTQVNLALGTSPVTEDGITNLVYTFTRTGNIANALTVNYGVGGTATFGNDYAQTGATSFSTTTGTVVFAAGATTAIVTIDSTTDTVVETDETVALTLANGAGYSVGTIAAITGTITNDDANVTLAVSPLTVNEDGTTNLVYTFTRTGNTANALTVNYGVGGTAAFGTDYAQTGATSFAATAGSVVFAAGIDTVIVTINPTADTVFEANETVALTLASGTGYSVGTIAAITGTITNDDTQVNLVLGTSPVTEDATAKLLYIFTRTGNIANALTVNYGVSGTATFGTDYAQTGAASFTATTGTVVFAAGANTVSMTIDPTTDTVFEANETVALTLTSGTGYSIPAINLAAIGTITNDDPIPAISIGDFTIVEGINGDPSQALITVYLSNTSIQAVGVNYATSNVTAIAGTDYTATTGTLTFAAGEMLKTIIVPILNDNLNEANETFSINLTTPTNATIADNKATITITDTFSTNVTSTLAALVENITLTDTMAINATANDGNNVITGNAANNILAGLNGDDTYIFDADIFQGTDIITEAIRGGIDTLNFTKTAEAIDINLELTTAQIVNSNLRIVIPVIAIENLIGGAGNDRLTGNKLANTIQGDSGDDLIFGGSGDDLIFGGGGNDIIFGQDGDDTIFGQGGNDILSGGAGNDIFYYKGLLSGAVTSSALFGIDRISNFTSAQDKISLSKGTFGAITSAAGTAIGANFVTVDDDSLVDTQSAAIVYSLNSGGLFYNQNGAAAGFGANGGQFANLLASPTLLATDFTISV
jgi:Ca2+-binding RTX toxin-like protein